MADPQLGDLGKLGERFENLRPLLDRIGIMLVGRQAQAFIHQKRGNARWPARSVPNLIGLISDLVGGGAIKKRRWEPRPAGVDTSRLSMSLSYDITGPKSVATGSKLPYAAKIHEGGHTSFRVPRELIAPLTKEMRRARKRGDARMIKLGWLFHFAKEGLSLELDVPARPFATVEDEDWRDIREVSEDWFING